MDSGKVAAEFLTFQLKVAKLVLSLSRHASSDGALGELGWPLDASRSTLQLLQTSSRFAKSPPGSLPSTFYAHTLDACRRDPTAPFPYFLHATLKSLDDLNLDFASLESKCAKSTFKRVISKADEQAWQSRILLQPRLHIAFPPNTPLKPQWYLKLGRFRGSRLLTKTRLDDLPLLAASYNTGNPKLCPL